MKRKIKLCFGAFLGLVGLLGSVFVFGMGIWCLPRHKYSCYEVQRDRQIAELGYYNHDIEYPLTEEDKNKLNEYEFFVCEWYWCLVACLGALIVSIPSLCCLVYCVEN